MGCDASKEGRWQMKRRIIVSLFLALLAVAAFSIDIPCGSDPWPSCDLNPPTKGGGGN